VVIARPQTFMNASGSSIAPLVKKLDIAPPDLIVIHDDLDLPTGKLRIRFGGSAGGHKGIASIIANLGSQDFCRVKVGIGRPETGDNVRPVDKEAAVVDYVLSDFTAEEMEAIPPVITEAGAAVICLLTEGLEAAMNKYN